MATRFYLPGSGSTPVVDIDPGAIWENTSGVNTRPCDVVKTNTAITTVARTKGSTTAWDDRLDQIFISTPQLAAQTISAGTFSMVVRSVESATAADFYLQIRIKVVSADGTTTRGDIFAGETLTAVVATLGARNQELPTTSATRIKSAIATTSVTAQAGDRIVIAIGARGGGTTSTHSFNLRFGDPSATADFALTQGLTTDLCPWVELSNDLTWYVPNGSGTGSWSFAGAGSGVAPSTTAAHRANALGNNGSGQSNSTSFTIPAGAATDGTDYAVVGISLDIGGASAPTLTPPTGWSLLSGPDVTPSHTAYLYGKAIAPGEPGTTVTWHWSNFNAYVPGHMAVYKNVNPAGLLVGTANVDNTDGTTIDIPSLGSVPAGALVHAHFALRGIISTPPDVTTPAGYSAGANPRSAAGPTGVSSAEHAYKVASSAGTYGGETATLDISAHGVVYILALPDVSTKTGSGTGTWTFTGAGSGKRVAGGSGTGAWAFSGAGSGTRQPKASGAGTFTFTGAGTGARPAGGTGTGAWAFTGAGVGSLPAKGNGSGAWTFTGTGSGEYPRSGTGSGTWTWVGDGTGIQPTTPSHVPGTAVLTPQTLGTATLTSNGLHTAVLAGNGLSTAVITSTPGTATIQTT